MSTIKHSSAHKNHAPKKAPAKPAASSTSKPAAKPTETSKPSEAAKPARDAASVIKPTDGKKPEDLKKPLGTEKPEGAESAETKPGETTEADAAAKPQELDENGKPVKSEDGKPVDAEDPKDSFEESEELKAEKEETDGMREELEGLKDALAALYDTMGSKEEKSEAPKESPGMCCGRPKSPQTATDGDGNKDWNSILTAGIAAVKAQGLGQGNLTMLPGGQGQQKGQGAQKLGAIGQAKPGQIGGHQAAGKNGGAGPGQQTDLRTKLASDYEKAKSSNAELKPEIENEVRNLLGMSPLDNQQGQGAHGLQGQMGQKGQTGQSFPMVSGF